MLFQPSPPPCVKCGTTTVVAPAFEEGQRAFAVRCPACGRAGTYSLDYSAIASGEPDHRAASIKPVVFAACNSAPSTIRPLHRLVD
jgi:phage terminase large subunit GpA-like protein